MMRLRVVIACSAHTSSRRYFSGMFATTLPLLCGKKDKPNSNTPVYYNPHTWPKHWTASDIQKLLEDHLLDPNDAPIFFDSLKSCLDTDMRDLEVLVRRRVKPPSQLEVDVESYLREHLDPKSDGAEMPLQERAPQLKVADDWLRLSPGSEKRQVALCYSPRGSGKTQFVKSFVHEKRLEAMKRGRVIVRCCAVAAQQKPQSWLTHVLQDGSQHQRLSNADNFTGEGLCELIREHVESVTGYPQVPFNYRDAQTAYDTWMSETAWFFEIQNDKTHNMDPLIILDSCEKLAEHEHHSHKHTSINGGKTPYTLLEAFCLAMPSPLGRGLFIGCNAKFDANFSLSFANVRSFGPLLPLTLEGFKNAMENSWKRSVDNSVVLPLYDLCGGQPRFLRHAVEPHYVGGGSVDGFFQWFEALKEAAKPEVSAEKDKWFPYAHTCLLASSTKAKVEGNIVVNPEWVKDARMTRTYDEAMIFSIGTYDAATQRFMVPPIAFVDPIAPIDSAKSNEPIRTILPSDLHPFLKSEVAQLFRHADALERGRQFEKPFTYAVYARYLLEYWKDTSNPWVSLTKVFEDAIQAKQLPVMDEYEVNLSAGMKSGAISYEAAMMTANVITHVGRTAHHDAYIWCRKKKNKKHEFVIPLQIRFGDAKELWKLKEQLLQSKDTGAEEAQLLLSVNQTECHVYDSHWDKIMMINADKMSTLGWLKWI